MNVLAEYPERLLPRDRSRSIELINMFLDLYSKHIGHANMVLSHASSNGGHHTRGVNSEGGYGGPSWSPSAGGDDGRDHRHGANGSSANGSSADPTGASAGGTSTNGTAAAWQQTSAGGSSQEMIQHPATPLLDTLSQCLTWARHGGVM